MRAWHGTAMPGGAPGKLEIAKLDCGSLEHLMKILDSWGGDFLLAAKRFANKIGGNLSTKRHHPNELLSAHPVFCGVFLYSAQTLIRNCALRWEAETGVKQAAAHIYNACTASGQLTQLWIDMEIDLSLGGTIYGFCQVVVDQWTAGNENGILPVVGWPTDWLLGHSHLAPLSMRPHVAGQRLPFSPNQF